MGLALMNLVDLVGESDSPDNLEVRSSNKPIRIRCFRPQWWVDKDPVTGKPIIAE